MPAPKQETWRPSECPTHGPVQAIWLDGHYGRWSAFHERARYTCVRIDENGKRRSHRFVVTLAARRPTEHSIESAPQTAAGTEADAAAAPPTADASTFSIPEIAGLLIAVGTGKPLRDAAHDLRLEASRRHCAPSRGRARRKLEPRPGELPDAPLAELAARPIRPAEAAPGETAGGAAGDAADAPAGDDAGSTRARGGAYNYSAPKRVRRVDASRSASVAMDYVDQYGPVVLRDVAPDRWPVYVTLGAVPLLRRGRGAAATPATPATPECLACGPDRGEVLVAADCELPGREYPFHARLGGGTDKDSWLDFLTSLAGRPTWIAARRHQGLAEAVAELWPGTILHACEDGLRDELIAAARRDRLPDPPSGRGPLADEIRAAFRDRASWWNFVVAAHRDAPIRASSLRAWLQDNEQLVLDQLDRKREYRRAPFTDAAVRPAMEAVRTQLLAHAATMRNLWRVNLRLAMMSAHWAGLDLEAEYVAALNRHFAAASLERNARARTGGTASAARRVARPDWASGRDFGGARSIDDFLAAAAERRQANHAAGHLGLLEPSRAFDFEDLRGLEPTVGSSARPDMRWLRAGEFGHARDAALRPPIERLAARGKLGRAPAPRNPAEV